ncbi:hypothetical protein GGR52DRAFT_21144 [Hypoxylon sp. FL1284]|nr:hypothetical protein GGR52DRAFT_21144 [Hypoxylon sp. FL1284]
MSSRGRDYDRQDATRHRSRSRAFIEALGHSNVRDAIGAFKPGSDPGHHHSHQRSRRHHDDDYYDDYYDDSPPPRHRGRHDRRYDDAYPSDEEDDYYHEREARRPRRPRRHRSTHHGDRRDRDRRPSSKRRRAASMGPNLRQAAAAAAAAGIVEAWRSRRDADRMARVATAAIGAAATDAFIGVDDDRKHKRHAFESVLAGLAENRILNGHRQ